jgi:pre-mRNA-processing factor 17
MGKFIIGTLRRGKVFFYINSVLRTYKLKRIPFTMKFHPTNQNSFLVGSNNKKILQFDIDTGTKTFEYSQHSGTINTIDFIEENKFVSSADDKKLFVWEYGIPVVTKHVSDPEMHTITATAIHPGGEYYAGQSSDNQICIYENKGGNFRRIRSKKFASHYSAGYACAIDFSNDGQFLISGDERGKLVFYDWKTSKTYRTIDAHPSVCIGAEWHPSDPNMVVTCGWEGQVKLWQ